MNDSLLRLLTRPEYVSLIQERLPPAFQEVEAALTGNPAVGLLREQVIIGMLMAVLGKSNVGLVSGGVTADIDCYVAQEPLSIKTVSLSGGVRLKWTSNAELAIKFMRTYKPLSDLLIVRIAWGSTGSFRYIPLSSQQSAFN